MSQENSAPPKASGASKFIVPIIIILIVGGFYLYKNGKDNSSTPNQSQTEGSTKQGKGFELVGSSGAAMTVALDSAIKNKQWIVVTGWTPHWMFNRWELKYLDDPKNVYGGAEEIRTITRKGLGKEMPEVVKFLDAFNWSPEDMQTVMVWNKAEGANPYENAKRWIKENDAKVEDWLKGIKNRKLGKTLKMANVAWASEIASSNVVKAVLEEKLGCKCNITNTTAALMYESVATGDQDFMTGAWLPSTQKDYYEKTIARMDDLGPNLKGTKTGLVVPAYVTISSIDELAGEGEKFEYKIIGIDPGAGIMKATDKALTDYALK